METIPNQTMNLFERVNAWIQESIMVKLISIGFLVLILLIPGAWIESLIYERQSRADEAMNEVASKWSGSQTILGPVLVIPYKRHEVIDRGKDGVEIHEYVEKAYFLPDQLDITGTVDPTVLHRGIFDAVVYNSNLNVESVFETWNFKSLNIDEKNVIWSDAYLAFGITDLRGINDIPVIKSGEVALSGEPSSNLGISTGTPNDRTDYDNYSPTSSSAYTASGIVAKLNMTNKESFNGKISIKLPLKGSRTLNFVPAGKTTSVTLKGAWNNPSFDGEFLPESREITEETFTASWKVLHFNRPFAQQWVQNDQQLTGADFGVNLLLPVDQYQKSMRTAKYGALIILLTFISLFLVEITQKVRIHPFQYILIGAALTIYYALLLSISEHFGYNVSYVISSLATVLLIGFYSTTFLPSFKLTMIFTIVLFIFYTFIFLIIQEQDYSLLIGSVGLFLIIGLLMFFSRKINWYKPSQIQS
ncbi:MAG TPA: cell envelope integrity protein CreD [Chryseosolibacter sp.]|nr:cell envelope integrity protein CreD [Chryseosolibacter sp.]